MILNSLIPFKGFVAMNLFGIFLIRKDEWLKESEMEKMQTIRHENIHTAQMRELLYIPFYVIYILEWFVRLFTHPKSAYMGISFEREAYENSTNPDYLLTRKHFAQWRH